MRHGATAAAYKADFCFNRLGHGLNSAGFAWGLSRGFRKLKPDSRNQFALTSLLLRLVFVDGLLQIIILFTLAEKRTGFFERRQLLLGVVELVHVEIQLTQIFMRAPMAGVYL